MIIDKNTKITLISGLNIKWPLTDAPVKGRPFNALSFRIKGDGFVTQGDKTEQLTTGSVLFMPQGADYYMKTNETEIYVIHFLAEGFASKTIRLFHPKNVEKVSDLFFRLFQLLNSQMEGVEFKALSVFYEIIYQLQKDQNENSSAEFKKIKPALDYLHANFTDPELSVLSICKKSFFSDTYFRKLFYNIFKSSPLNYLNNLRVSHAKTLLTETDHALSNIAVLSGFYDEKYFCKLFKKKTGKTPTEYRNEK